MSETRRCEVNYSYEIKKGNFHRYGDGVVYDDGGQLFSKTIAIVELDGGDVVEVSPHMIKFIDDKSKV